MQSKFTALGFFLAAFTITAGAQVYITPSNYGVGFTTGTITNGQLLFSSSGSITGFGNYDSSTEVVSVTRFTAGNNDVTPALVTENGLRIYDEFTAVGDLDVGIVIFMDRTAGTPEHSFYRGLDIAILNTSGVDISSIQGANLYIENNDATIGTMESLYLSNYLWAGTATEMSGIKMEAPYVESGATASTVYGLNLGSWSTNGGSVTTAYGIYVGDWTTSDSATEYNIYSAGANALNNFQGIVQVGSRLELSGVVFASLGTPTNGSIRYCSNCTIANPCASGGNGAIAKRLNGAWVCN